MLYWVVTVVSREAKWAQQLNSTLYSYMVEYNNNFVMKTRHVVKVY